MIQVQNILGINLHETYDKRARGLVKKGRAFYVDEHTICLLHPAIQEDKVEYNVTLQDLLKRLDKVNEDNGYIHEAMQLMERLPYDLNNEQAQMRSYAIMEMVKQREETNRKTLDIIETMYEDLKVQD